MYIPVSWSFSVSTKATGIKARVISAYLNERDPAMPGRARCLVLEKASKELGYNFSASDWMFNPEKIRKTLIDQTKHDAA